MGTTVDQEGCDCAYGYARLTEQGICRPVEYCPAESSEEEEEKCPRDRNEVYTCGTSCEERCHSKSCSDSRRHCSMGCFCAPGYRRIGDKCLPKSKCNYEYKCREHERFHHCQHVCWDSCDPDCFSNTGCSPGCFCKEGFKRTNGTCVLKAECPITVCPKENEVYKCGDACVEICNSKSCPPTRCTPGCFCAHGHRRLNGKCIPESQCPWLYRGVAVGCGQNARFNPCGNVCSESCDPGCSSNSGCSSGCFCQEGFKRINGTCVPKEECPGKCRADMEWKLSSSCFHECLQPGAQCSAGLELGCYCKGDGVLVPGTEECLDKKICDQADSFERNP